MEGFRISISVLSSSSGGNKLSERRHERSVWHEDSARSLVVNTKTAV